MTEDDFKKKYEAFRESIPSIESGKYARLYTAKRNIPFRLYKNSKGIYVKPFSSLEYSKPQAISLNRLAQTLFQDKEYHFKSYEPILLERIKNSSLIKENEIFSESTQGEMFGFFETEESFYERNKIKNIILYGSPGVGKTHNTNKLIRMIEDGNSEQEIFKAISQNEKNNGIDISDIEDRVEFITFHQSFGYEDFIEGFRPNEEGKIELEKGVFRNICQEAQENLHNSQSDTTFDFNSFLSDFIQEVQENEPFEIDQDLTITVKRKSNGDFQSFLVGGRVKNQSLTKEIIQRDFGVFMGGGIQSYHEIKPTFQSQSSYHGNAPYYFKLYEKMKTYLKNSSHNYENEKVQQQNYYLVIDEINRGNISKVFGELITLIEENKRDQLEVILPYSKEPFRVPSNLYIIGTMNSTDKSIALIDIALRRRFTFLKMQPNSELVPEGSRDIFKQLNEHISQTLGEDYQIGHSYFMNHSDLDFVLKYKIEPLLEEYYYGNKEGFDRAKQIIYRQE